MFGAPPRVIASISSAASSSPRAAFLPVVRQKASMSVSTGSSATPSAVGDLLVGHVEVGADQSEDVQQFRGGRGALLVGLRGLPIGDRFVVQRRELFRRDERVDLGDDDQPRRAEERHRAIRVEDRRELAAGFVSLDGDAGLRRDDRVAQIAKGILGEKVARSADEDDAAGSFARRSGRGSVASGFGMEN